MTLYIVGFDDLVTSFVATIATGWSDPCRVGLPPTEKPRLYAAHTKVLAYELYRDAAAFEEHRNSASIARLRKEASDMIAKISVIRCALSE